MDKIAFSVLVACGLFVATTVANNLRGNGYQNACGDNCHEVDCEDESGGAIVLSGSCSNILQNVEIKNITALISVIGLDIISGCANDGNCDDCAGLLGLDGVTALIDGGKSTQPTCCSNAGWGGGDNAYTGCGKANNQCSNDCTQQSSGDDDDDWDRSTSGEGYGKKPGCDTSCCSFQCKPSSSRLV